MKNYEVLGKLWSMKNAAEVLNVNHSTFKNGLKTINGLVVKLLAY